MSDDPRTSNDQTAKYRAEEARHQAERTRSITHTIRLVGLWMILATIFIVVLVTQNDPTLVKQYAGGLLTAGFVLSLLL